MAFYDEMAQVALDLVTEFGQIGTLTCVTEGEYDPVTLTQSGQLLLLEYTAAESGVINASGSLVQQGYKKILLAAKGLAWAPTMTITIDAGGQVWTIVNIKSVNPAGTPLVYEIHGRR